MNVFIEGPNGSGKSTLADYVKNLLRWDQLNLHHRDGDQFRRYLAEYGRDKTVFVRAHWSEAVYSLLFGRAEPFSAKEYKTLTDAATLRGVYVLCLPNGHVLKERYQARISQGLGGAMQEKLEQIDTEWDLWSRQRDRADIVYHSLDQSDMIQTAEWIMRMVKAREVGNV